MIRKSSLSLGRGASEQVDEEDGQEILMVMQRLSAAAYLSRYAANIRLDDRKIILGSQSHQNSPF